MVVKKMNIAIFAAALLFLGSAWSQQSVDETSPSEVEKETENAEAADAENTGEPPEAERAEVLETDDESYLDIESEDFRPSEEIPTDQSIAFPTDI
jgi:hypothetical protein